MIQNLSKCLKHILNKRFVKQIRIFIFLSKCNFNNYIRTIPYILFLLWISTFVPDFEYNSNIKFQFTDLEGCIIILKGKLLILYGISCILLALTFAFTYTLFLLNYSSKYYHIQKSKSTLKPVCLMFVSLIITGGLNNYFLNHFPHNFLLEFIICYGTHNIILYLLHKIKWFEHKISLRSRVLTT